MSDIYFLRLLLTDADSVIPPGKSLLSMLTKNNVPQEDTVLHNVTQVAHRAFWSEALDSLSSPLPAIQLPRLGRLYLDLHEALASLFPPKHPILVSLSSPLPPTSSPLHSTLSLLKEILMALRQRCAPARDPTVDQLLASFSNIPSSTLPQFVIDMIKATISFADNMKSDLSTFVIGSMTEPQLRTLLSNEVKSRERDLVLKIWGAHDVVRHSWRIWLDHLPEISRLVHALFSDNPVFCTPPTTIPSQPPQSFAQHQLPPQLYFSAHLLLDLQNHLQAIVIAAALRSLVRLPSTNTSTTSDFMSRIWTLLKSEINSSHNFNNQNDTEQLKTINLADEVVRATQSSVKLNTSEEQALRSAVERTLRPNDPVFLLLKKRLMGSLTGLWLSPSSSASASEVPSGSSTTRTLLPGKMLAGRTGQKTSTPEKRLKLMVSESLSYPSSSSHRNVVLVESEAERMIIPGFEDLVLRKAIGESAHKLADCIDWVENVWGDLV